MIRRSLIKLTGVMLISLAVSGFKLPSIGGGSSGGGGADWKSIVSDFKTGFGKINQGLENVLEGIASSYEAIGLKEKAAVARQNIDNLKSAGDKLGAGSDAASVQGEYMTEASVDLAKEMSAKTLTADEKAKLLEASKNYFMGAKNAIPGYIKVIATGKKAQDAGTPSPTDLMGVAGAGDLPGVVKNIPAFFKMIPATFKAFQAYKKSLEKADIKPDISDSELAVPTI